MATAFIMKGIIVSLIFCPNWPAGTPWRSRSNSVTSASSKLVTCGIVEAARVIWSAMVRRMREIFSTRTGPQASEPDSPDGTAGCKAGADDSDVAAGDRGAVAAGAGAGDGGKTGEAAGAACEAGREEPGEAAPISSGVMRPYFPLPATARRSIP